MTEHKYDTVVIGAGVAGMTSSILLACTGRRVAIVEKAHVMAPTIRGFCRDGVYFDTGFHYAGMLGPDDVLTQLSNQLGILQHLKVVKSGLDTKDLFRCTQPHFTLEWQHGLDGIYRQLSDVFRNDSMAIERYLNNVKAFLERINMDVLDTMMNPPEFGDGGRQSLSHFLKTQFSDPLVQAFFSVHSLLYGSLPEETSVDYHSMIAGGFYDQSYQIVEGGSAVAEAFEKELITHNVDIFTGHAVEQVTLNKDKAIGSVVLGNGVQLECAQCVYTGYPSELVRMMPEGCFRPIYINRLQDVEPTLSAVVVYCAPESDLKFGELGNLILIHDTFPDYYQCQDGYAKGPIFISQAKSLKYREGISLICPSTFNEVAAWENSHVGNRPAAYYEWKKRASEKIVSSVQTHLHDVLPDLRVLDVATPLTFRDYMSAPRGCLYGKKHRLEDMPLLPRTRIQGLYLSGQGTMACGILGAMLSGFLTVGSMLGENIFSHWKV